MEFSPPGSFTQPPPKQLRFLVSSCTCNSFGFLSPAGPDVPGLLHLQLSDDPAFDFARLLVLPDNTDCLQGMFPSYTFVKLKVFVSKR